ncbi:MAG TPA: EAL domain-containing protein, partial [Motiliproteus sp.]
RIQRVNRAACEQLGFDEPQLLGMSLLQLLDNNDDAALLHLLEHRQRGKFEDRLKHSEGHPIPALMSVSTIAAEGNYTHGYLLVATNISARKLAEEKIHKLAFYDSLSGLPNRTLFYDRLTQAVKFAARQRHALAVMFLDLDNFKQINDTLGHDVGDALIAHISEKLVALLRSSDVVANNGDDSLIPTVSRHGGDEFLILLPYIAAAEDAGQVATRIQHSFTEPLRVKIHELFVSFSIGIAIAPGDGQDARLLVQNADTALYNAKAAGKARFAYFEPQMNSSALRRLELDNALRKGLEKKEFELYFQPQLELSTGRLMGMEALVRWNHPEWGLIPPLEFIPVAESNGLISPLGDWILEEACSRWSQWQREGLRPGKLSVNLSALQFRDGDLAAKVAQVIEDSGVLPDMLVLEITESLLMSDAEETLSQLKAIKATGVRLAVDDFGTGYSSLSYLKAFPLDYLKIDRAFIQDLESSASDLELVRTIIAMAKGLKLELVAEGVETPGQLRILQAQECDAMQGYLLSRPLPAAEYRLALLDDQGASHGGLEACRTALEWRSA